ncbi:MAG: 2-oxo-4-hydroxy-4-carboxy-5-ureidoimidazoline decarboxylase [Pseudomonadales bacterium]
MNTLSESAEDSGVQALNQAPARWSEELFLRCSHSALWAQRMLSRRPFCHIQDIRDAASAAWVGASEQDWLDAFSGHPKIGDVDYLRARFDQQARNEQGQVLSASTATLASLADLNQRYLERHGFIFIIRAAGLSAEAMLAALQSRIDRSRSEELEEAARQHARIALSRLEQEIERLATASADGNGTE